MGKFTVGCLLALWAPVAYGQVLTTDLEVKHIPNLGGSWQTIALENTYTDPIIVCTYRLPSISNNAATTRIRNITPTSFELMAQEFETSTDVTPSDVYCIISDEGAYDSGGLKYEARKVLSDQTGGQFVTNQFNSPNTEDVTSAVTQSYTAPAVLGQVMSFNDSRASAIFTSNCNNRLNPPFSSGFGLCVGKHIGQINGTRLDETLGYFVVEGSTGTVNDITFAAALGPDSVAGTGDAPPYIYNVSGDFDMGVLTQAAMDGINGSWAVFYGSDGLPSGQINLAVDEEVFTGDQTRRHTLEQVAYWIFDNNQTASLAGQKDVEIYSGSASPYAIPGSDVIYTIKAVNNGSGPVDADSIFLVDAIPPEVTFYNGDIDDGGPLTGVVEFTETGSGLTFTEATDLGFSNEATKPTSFAECSYSPAEGYDPNITFICLSPEGTMLEGTLTPSEFEISFRALLK